MEGAVTLTRAPGLMKAFAIGLLQFVLANIATLLLSFPVNMQPEQNPWGVAAVLTVASLLGIAAGGWIGVRAGWLPGVAAYAVRASVAAAGILALLGLALALGQMREASPLLTGAMVAGIVGFHAPGWFIRAQTDPEVVTPRRS